MTMHPCLRLGLVVCTLAACTDADLYRPIIDDIIVYDNKLKLSGRFCTTDPADVVFPLKVMFIIDTSQSMNVNDPVLETQPDPTMQTGRARAIRDVVEHYINIHSSFTPIPCNTGVTGCEKGKVGTCSACGGAGFMCVGPDCCLGTPAICKGVPACPTAPGTNGTCIPLCDTAKAGCGPSETGCPDCPDANDRCLGGICGNHKDPGVEFAIARFGSAKQVLTRNSDGLEGFTNDVVELVSSIPQVSNGGSVTDYEGAFSMAYQTISADIKRMMENNAAAVNRTRYVVVFLSDGEPYPRVNDEDDWTTVPDYIKKDLIGDKCADVGNMDACTAAVQEYNIPNRILQRVQEVMSLKTLYRLGDVKLHSAFLAGNNPSWVEDEATYLLKQIAQIGKGTFRSFPNGEDINFLKVGFSSLKRVFRMKNLIVSNLSARPAGGTSLKDSDIDGLDDREELQAGTDPTLADTDGDNFSDLLEHFYRTSGWDPLDPADADCPLLEDKDGDRLPDDTDGDGLLDCEERFLGTSRNQLDSDGDGVPDGLELRFGTNPVVVDIDDDLDFDGMSNGDEIRLHTDPRADDAAHRSRINYRYHVRGVGTGIEVFGLTCARDEECPSGLACKERLCRCTTAEACSSGSSCTGDGDCTFPRERCINTRCTGPWECNPPTRLSVREPLKESDSVCSATKHVSCYDYEVENITLVTPRATPATGERGWNHIQLYFGEVPFDNPGDQGNFSVACVKAWYDETDGRKLPAISRLTVPETAWHDPRESSRTYVATATAAGDGMDACGSDPASLAAVYCSPGDGCIDPAGRRCKVSVCVCPDGKVGHCR